MRLQYLRLENFKCFRKLDIDFGKITLLTGANSSGKSSVIYSILGAIQSGEFPFQFSPNGKFVEMGDYREMVFGHDERLEIGIAVRIEGKTRGYFETSWRLNEEHGLPQLSKMILSDLEKGKGGFSIIRTEKGYEKHLAKETSASTSTPSLARLGEGLKTASSFFMEYWDLVTDIMSSDAKPDAETVKDISEWLKNKGGEVYIVSRIIKKEFDAFESNLNYIGSFRLQPERTYYEQTKTQLKVGKHGEQYTDQIILWQTQKAKELGELQRIGQSLGLFHRIFAKRSDGGRYELRVQVSEDELDASLTDVGFGISQFLPIVVADLQMGDDSVLFVSQPETHLHPSIQSTFADYLVDRILHTNKTYVIETHSEYLINRLRLAIAQKRLQEEDLKAYYFKKTGIEATSYPLRFLPNGQILGAPEDFFKTYMMDVMEIAMTAE